MSKINWNTILEENLLILGYPFDSNNSQSDLFQFENNKALQDILNFILLRVDPKAHEEFSNFLRNTNGRKGRMMYLRQMFNWSIEVIMETFNDYECNSALFISPKAPQIHEFLGKLTTSVLKIEMKKLQKNSSCTLRPRVILSDLQSNGQCFADNLSTVNEDFARETKSYLEHLNTLVTRKEVVEKELKRREEARNELLKQIASLKREINSNSNVQLNEIDENSIALYDADISQRLHETDCRYDKLSTTLEQMTVLCSNVQERFAKKSDDVKIDILSSINMENNSLIDNDKISIKRMFSKLKTELIFNKSDYDELVIRKSENRVRDGIHLVESSLSQNLMGVAQIKQNLLQMQNKIVQLDVTNTSNCLANFMPLPTVSTFLASYGDGNNDSNGEIDSKIDFVDVINDENSSIAKPEEPDFSTNQIKPILNRHSKVIAENFGESLEELNDSKFQGITTSDVDLDSNKSETTYNVEARFHEINLQPLSTETINKFLNRAPESDSTIFSDSDFLYLSDPNDSFLCSPPTACKLDDGVARVMVRMKNLLELEKLPDDEFLLKY